MNFSPTLFMAQLLVSMHVFMTLNMMPLGTTMALPITSKPIESTVENLAWQAWIELPPEQKQQVKSRKVTPKSIFTLPLRVECPEGHKHVDNKCIPIVIGSNAVLIDLNALGLVVGNTPTEELYDYDDIGDEEDLAVPQPQFSGGSGNGMQMGEKEKSVEGLTVELKPPTKDEPLKFNIFETKFHIFHEEPLDDYSALSNEGGSEYENISSGTTQQPLNATTARAVINDLASEASDILESESELIVNSKKTSSNNTINENSKSTNLSNDDDFKMDAISLPVGRFEIQKPQKLAVFQNDSSLQLVTTIMDSETTTISDEKPQENDIQTLLQTESFMPLLQPATATTLENSEPAENFSAPSALTTTPSPVEEADILLDNLNLNVDEEMTTMTSVIEAEIAQVRTKEEFTRSVTMNPLIEDEGISMHNNDRFNDTTTLETEMMVIDEAVETTTPIQLDETTIIETSSSLSTTLATQHQNQQPKDSKELLLKPEQSIANLKELQRIRKGQKDQHVVLKKMKVEPVANNNLATAAETATETLTPLLTAHNENDNKNDRFYYQHITKQETAEIETQQQPIIATSTAAVGITKPSEIVKMPLTSEIDLKEELRLINELVKGIKPATKTLTTMRQTSSSSTTTTTTTTEKPKTTMNIAIPTTLSSVALSESSSIDTQQTTLSSQETWSKIMPTTADNESKIITNETLTENTADVSKDVQTTQASGTQSRNERNSKIIRINGFSANNLATVDGTTTTTSSSDIETSTENQNYEPYWWLPISWRYDTPIAAEGSEKHKEDEQLKNKEPSLLLRLWSAYAPKSR